MGYTTDFQGEFKINKKVDEATYDLLIGLATTRRMKRGGLDKKIYGVEGEFFTEDRKNFGQYDSLDKEDVKPSKGTVLDYNSPPKTQPGLWCQWLIQKDKQTIKWDGGEKFYEYIQWIEYLINSVLKPRGYIVNGKVEWIGEDSFNDQGIITVKNNIVIVVQTKG